MQYIKAALDQWLVQVVLPYVPQWLLPDHLTYVRLFCPIFAVMLSLWIPLLGLTVYALGAMTDYFDGWLARSRGQTSAWGKRIDELADKLYVLLPLLCFIPIAMRYWNVTTVGVAMMAGVLLVTVVRDGLVSQARARGRVASDVLLLARYKTTLQMIGVSLLFLVWYDTAWLLLALICLIVATILLIVSGWQYLRG